MRAKYESARVRELRRILRGIILQEKEFTCRFAIRAEYWCEKEKRVVVNLIWKKKLHIETLRECQIEMNCKT